MVARTIGEKPSPLSIGWDYIKTITGKPQEGLVIDGEPVSDADQVTIFIDGRSATIQVHRRKGEPGGEVWTTSEHYTVTGSLSVSAGVHVR